MTCGRRGSEYSGAVYVYPRSVNKKWYNEVKCTQEDCTLNYSAIYKEESVGDSEKTIYMRATDLSAPTPRLWFT